MASSKEMQQSSRPMTQHRPSLSSSSASGLSGRGSHARANSHSLIAGPGALNVSHRVTRRKSVTNANPNMAALTAAMPIANSSRRNTTSKSAAARAAIVGSLPSPPASLPSGKSINDIKRGLQGSAIDDDSNDMSADEGLGNAQKARIRRASDGQPLIKEGRKTNRVEIRCETCGKGYKHSSCLTKHLWEHTPEWSLTSKLLISKHQQVQLLEAATVLVGMNGKEGSETPPESVKDAGSEPDTASPAASGVFEQGDRQSSADTTPPPAAEGLAFGNVPNRNKRNSSGSGFSRSYQSAPGFNGIAGSVPLGSGLGHLRQPSHDQRPTSSGANNTNQDDRDLAAAVELLSCSFGSNGSSRNTVTLPADAPPVPPLPAQYLDQANQLHSSGFVNSFTNRQPESFTRGEMRRGSPDNRMEDAGDSVMDDDDFDMHSRGRSDEDDIGVFGRMEE